MMMFHLLHVFTLLSGILTSIPEDIYVREGELVALQCPQEDQDRARFVLKNGTSQIDLHNMSVADQSKMGVMLEWNSLVILSASAKHEGNYSCSLCNSSCLFRLTVYSTQSKEHEWKTQYPQTCYEEDFCKMHCPDANIPSANTLRKIKRTDIIWYKPDGERERSQIFFISNVRQKDSGVYTCIRSYQYHHQLYNKTFKVALAIRPKEEQKRYASIIEPKNNEVFYVDLDAPKVIDCKAVVFSDEDETFWMSNDSFVEENNSLPVFYNKSRKKHKGETAVTASLVFKKVSEEDLTKYYVCKLDSLDQRSSFVTVTLSRKARPSYVSLAACSVGIMMVLLLTVVIYIKFKVAITLFMRDTVGCHRSMSDGKSYDIFMMSYKCERGGGLSGDDREVLESVLEERFGYTLCLFDRDVLPGESAAEAVLDCIEQSRAVLLVPTFPDPGLESRVLSAIHVALVERQTRLVFINPDTAEVLDTGSVPEALQLLSEAGGHVTWRGRSSMLPSAFFWKQLRYHLPVARQEPKLKLLPQTSQDMNTK